MKKTFLTSVIALAAIVSMPVSAQTTDATTGATKTEQTDMTAKKGPRDGKRHVQRKANAFEGINLTDAQKESLKALTPARTDRDAKKEGEKNDTLRARPDRNKMRSDYVNGVKGILTPEQYVVFLENIVINDAMIPGSGPDMHKGAMHKGDKAKMHKGDKEHKREGKGPRDGKRTRPDRHTEKVN